MDLFRILEPFSRKKISYIFFRIFLNSRIFLTLYNGLTSAVTKYPLEPLSGYQDTVGDAMEISAELWNVIIKMLFFLVVLTALFLMAHLGLQRLGRKQTMRTGGMPIEILFSRYLGSKKSISMVKIPGAILVLGITPDRINLLSRIEKTELVESICEDKPGSSLPVFSSFQKLYFRFLLKNRDKPSAK